MNINSLQAENFETLLLLLATVRSKIFEIKRT